MSCCKYGRQCANTSNVCARHSAILAFAGSRSAIQGRTAARGTIILLSRERLFSWSCCVGRRVHSLRRPVAGGCCVQHGGAGHVMGPFRHAARFRRCSGRTHSSIDRSVGPVRCVQERHCPRGEHRLRAPGRAPACSLGFAWQQQPPLWPPALVPLRERRWRPVLLPVVRVAGPEITPHEVAGSVPGRCIVTNVASTTGVPPAVSHGLSLDFEL